MSVALETRAVRKRYGATTALDGVDLTVRAGEFVALLGPNGAGKSTLFQLLSGLFVADGGEVLVHGVDMARQPTAALAQLGIVFQAPTLDLDLSVEHNLRFHCQLHGIPRAAASTAIDTQLGALGLEQVRGTTCRALSGGNRRKVELARALLHQPRTLLMDEATVGLDPASRKELLAQVRALCAERQLAVLWTTHLVEEVEDADRIVMLHKGRVRAEGDRDTLVNASSANTLLDAFIELTRDKPA